MNGYNVHEPEQTMQAEHNVRYTQLTDLRSIGLAMTTSMLGRSSGFDAVIARTSLPKLSGKTSCKFGSLLVRSGSIPYTSRLPFRKACHSGPLPSSSRCILKAKREPPSEKTSALQSCPCSPANISGARYLEPATRSTHGDDTVMTESSKGAGIHGR